MVEPTPLEFTSEASPGLHCLRCDYDVSGLSLFDVCPECALPIEKSADRPRLVNTGESTIRKVRAGAYLMFAVLPMSVVAIPIIVIEYRIAPLLLFLVGAAYSFGWRFMLCAPIDRLPGARFVGRRSRAFYQTWCAGSGLLTSTFAAVYLFSVPRIQGPTLWITGYLTLGSYLVHMCSMAPSARRILATFEHPPMETRTTLLSWSTLVLHFGVIFPLVLTHAVSDLTGSTVPKVVVMLSFLSFLVWVVWGMLVVYYLGRFAACVTIETKHDSLTL